jgi:hypothetical protein
MEQNYYGRLNMIRPTIKQQREMAQKSKKAPPKLSIETPSGTSETPPDTSEMPPDTSEMPPGKRDKQVTVKFSENDMERLKTAAGKARRPVANLIYSLTMEYVEDSEG